MPRIRQSLVFAATAALVAGIVSVPGPVSAADRDGAARAATQITWSTRLGPVPRASTTLAPALTSIALPGIGTRQLLLWAGPGSAAHGYQISYEFAASLSHNEWSPAAKVDHGAALTSARPSAASYGHLAGKIIVAWRGAGAAGRVWYSVGTGASGGAVSWDPQHTIPGAVTSAGPAVYAPLHSRVIFVTWKNAASAAIDYVVGRPSAAGSVSWSLIRSIPGTDASSPPAVAEASTGRTVGRLYVLWKAAGDSGRIDYSTTHDPLSADPQWAVVKSFPAAVVTGAAPAAEAIGPGGSFPLLIAYRARHDAHLLYATLARNGTLSSQRVVPNLMSDLGPALYQNVLAATAPDPGVYFHICGGC
jgi:hypothetical protein